MSSNKPFHECPYCFKKILSEKVFLKHNCEKKRRHDIMKSPKGTGAFFAYKEWMAAMGRRVSKKETFIDSKFFTSFINFIDFCRTMGIPDRKMYVRLMVDRKVPPSMWCKTELYEFYIEHFDSTKTPLELAAITIETLFSLAKTFECDMKDVFHNLMASELIKLIHARKLSPWLLLFSGRFQDYLRNKADANQRILINGVIDSAAWFEKFKKRTVDVEKMKLFVKELGI